MKNCINQTIGEHTGSPLHLVVQWFKTMMTNKYIHSFLKLTKEI